MVHQVLRVLRTATRLLNSWTRAVGAIPRPVIYSRRCCSLRKRVAQAIRTPTPSINGVRAEGMSGYNPSRSLQPTSVPLIPYPSLPGVPLLHSHLATTVPCSRLWADLACSLQVHTPRCLSYGVFRVNRDEGDPCSIALMGETILATATALFRTECPTRCFSSASSSHSLFLSWCIKALALKGFSKVGKMWLDCFPTWSCRC